MRIAREGWPYILGPLVAATALAAFHLPWLAAALAVLGIFSAFFFRDPERAVPPGVRLVISPADGRVVQILPSEDGPLGSSATQISIFLSIFNVHVNRAPIGGRIERVDYHPGTFLPAFDHRASLRNEQNCVTLRDGETRVAFKQIAGLIARRIVFRKRVDDAVAAGERVGMIKFGSRVDVFLPPGSRVLTKLGDRVRGGSSVLGELP